MEYTFLIDDHPVKFVAGTAIVPISGNRVEVLGAYDENDKNWRTTTAIDWLPQDADEAKEMLKNFDWETSSAISDFWPDTEF